MEKSSAKLDLKDKKILFELDKDARQSNSEIAKKVRLNKNTVTFRINRMEKEGIITGYYSVIDTAKLGYMNFRIYLKFFNTTSEQEKDMITWLKNNKIVGVLGKPETNYDLSIMVWIKNVFEFDDFWLEFKKRFRRYFWNEKVHTYTSVYHFQRKYLLGMQKEEEEYQFIGRREQAKHDELDLDILRILAKDTRIPLIKIAEKLKTPPRTIAFRIKQLENSKVIEGYRVNINLEKIGYEYYKINFILEDFDRYDALLSFSKNHPNMIYIDRTLSELDFEIDVEIEGRKELLALVEEIKRKFHVRDAEIFTYKEYYKLEVMPG